MDFASMAEQRRFEKAQAEKVGATTRRVIVLITQTVEWSVVVEHDAALDGRVPPNEAVEFIKAKLDVINVYKRLPFYVDETLQVMGVDDAQPTDRPDVTL